MLRRLLGDDAFFGALRKFYASAKFRKVGTDELKSAFEAESGRSLDRFFDQWIYGSMLPRLKVQYRVEGSDLAVHIEQLSEIFEIPVVLTVEFADRSKTNLVIPVGERTLDRRFPLSAAVRSVEINKDDGGLAEFVN